MAFDYSRLKGRIVEVYGTNAAFSKDMGWSERTMSLKMNGKVYLVHRPDRFLELMDEMRSHAIMPKKVRFIYPNESTNANMVLIEGVNKGKEGGFQMLPPLYVHDEHGEYRPEVRKILYGEG